MTAPAYDRHGITVHLGDCADVLREIAPASVDAIVTDPPYELGFMGRTWDASGIAYSVPMWTECLRVLKPGGWLASFGGSRTYHRMACAIEDAGFDIRDSAQWLYGSGFPKSRNVTNDLLAIPPCTCRVGSEVANDDSGVVEAAGPSGSVRAGVGAVPAAVRLTGATADDAAGQVPKAGAGPARRLPDVQIGISDVVGDDDPVMLGSLDVAGRAQGQQVAHDVGAVEVDPESLGDQVVGDEGLVGPAVGADLVAGDSGGGDLGPASSAVLPLPSAPRGVAVARVPTAVVGGHAGTGAVDAGVGPAAELCSADLAGVDTVAGRASSHADNPTAERRGISTCPSCGGRRGDVPVGLGTALKPAHEPIVLARKPLGGTVAATVLQHGTGAINIDACRVGSGERTNHGGGSSSLQRVSRVQQGYRDTVTASVGEASTVTGRWPSNVLLTHGAGCGPDEQPGPCVDGCPVADLDQQSGTLTSGYMRPETDRSVGQGAAYGEFSARTATATYGDQGGASRFFPTFRWEAKAPTSERPQVDGIAHPTVKPIALMRWLVRLLTPPGGLVLDPFAGSGTTLHAARAEGFRAIGVEREPDYLRLTAARLDARPRAAEAPAVAVDPSEPMDLLDLLKEEAS